MDGQLAPNLRSRLRWLIASAVAGLLVGYALVAPLGMIFFHVSHQGLTPAQLDQMQSSAWRSAFSSFGPSMWVWAVCFGLLGLAVGAIVGNVMFELDRRRRAVEVHAAALDEANSKLTLAYEQLLRADRLASLGILASTVIHDINNYLTLIIATAEDELEEVSEERRKDGWSSVLMAGTNIGGLCRSVRSFGAAHTSANGGADVIECVEESLLLIGKVLRAKSIEVVRDYPGERPRAALNPSELKQVFVNLIQNATDAIEGTGRLTIGLVDHNGGIGVRVTDTGEGIAPDVLPRVFDTFFTTKPEDRGTGLGLAICKRIAENAGGTIDVSSQPGEGTTFSLWLPRR